MTTERESDERVRRHAETLARRGVEPTDALIHSAGAEAGGKLTGVERVKRATAGNERQGASDADIIRMGEQASREANHGIPFHVKIARCAGTPDNDEEMRKAMAVTDRALDELRKATNRPRLKPSTTAPGISARAGKMPLRSFPKGRPGRPPAATPAAPRPMIGPSRQERIDGRGFDAYWDFRDQLAGDLRAKRVRPTPEALIDHSVASYGLDDGDAAAWTERFLDGINRDLERRVNPRSAFGDG